MALAPLLALIVVLGFFPKPALDVLNPTVDELLEHVGVTGSRAHCRDEHRRRQSK